MEPSRAGSLLLLLALSAWQIAGEISPYTVPEPYIQALRPKGLRFSIPDEPGVELFAVHANINKPMRDLEAGELSQDVLTTRDGRWVFEDPEIHIRPGDHINYWLYVKHNGLGYRKERATFTVTELMDHNSPVTPPVYAASCPKGCRPEGCEGGLAERLGAQRLRHQQELHEQRMRHEEELHRERLRRLQQGCEPGNRAANPPNNPSVQDVSIHRRIGDE